MTINVKPMPRRYLEISEKYRPQHPPIFDGTPTPDDIAEARALFEVLDPESQRWYGRRGIFAAKETSPLTKEKPCPMKPATTIQI